MGEFWNRADKLCVFTPKHTDVLYEKCWLRVLRHDFHWKANVLGRDVGFFPLLFDEHCILEEGATTTTIIILSGRGGGKVWFQLFSLCHSGLGVEGTHNTSCCGASIEKNLRELCFLLTNIDFPWEKCWLRVLKCDFHLKTFALGARLQFMCFLCGRCILEEGRQPQRQ